MLGCSRSGECYRSAILIEQLLARRDWHEDFLSTFVGSQFDNADGVVNRFDRPTEIESADDDESAFEAALDLQMGGYNAGLLSLRRVLSFC